MNIIVRFYWQHDLDLIALVMHPDFTMDVWLKRAMSAYTRGEELSIPLPSPQPFKVDLDSCYVHFTLTPGLDDDIIEAMNGFRTGFRNSAIKTIFRRYLSAPLLDPFYNEAMYATKSRVGKRAAKDETALEKPKKRRKKAFTTIAPTTPPVTPKKITPAVPPPVPDTSVQSAPIPPTPPVAAPVSAPVLKAPVVTSTPPEVVGEEPKEQIMNTPVEHEPSIEEDDGFDLFGAVSELIN